MTLKRDIPTLVREAASKWRERFVESTRGYGGDGTPLEKYVDEYMKKNFAGILDELLGIERRFGSVEVKKIHDGGTGMMRELVEKTRPVINAAADRIIGKGISVTLSKAETETLRSRFRTTLMYQIERRLDELAKQRAELITLDVLDEFMMGDEWIPIVEKRMGNAPKPDADAAE